MRFTGTRSSRGIIQGLFPSDLLGNFYLTPLDESLADWRVPSVRYVDDLFLFVSDQRAANHLLRRVTEELRKYDLTLNETKSYLLPTAALAADEPDLDKLFANAVKEAAEEFDTSEIDADYGFQTDWEDETEVQDDGEIELQATRELFSSIANFPQNEEK